MTFSDQFGRELDYPPGWLDTYAAAGVTTGYRFEQKVRVVLALAENVAEGELALGCYRRVRLVIEEGRPKPGGILGAVGDLEKAILTGRFFGEDDAEFAAILPQWELALLVGLFALHPDNRTLDAIGDRLATLYAARLEGPYARARAMEILLEFVDWAFAEECHEDRLEGASAFDVFRAGRPLFKKERPVVLAIPDSDFDEESLVRLRAAVATLRAKHEAALEAHRGTPQFFASVVAMKTGVDLVAILGRYVAERMLAKLNPAALYPYDLEADEQPDQVFARRLFRAMRIELKHPGKLEQEGVDLDDEET